MPDVEGNAHWPREATGGIMPPMPPLRSRRTWIALDMAGCPNRCRHCWLGALPNQRLYDKDLRWAVELFRDWVRPGEHAPFFQCVEAMTWWREPDYAPDYRYLWELERDLNGHAPMRFELLSIWRLARDESYASWAREVGTTGCQITVFGMEETHDWFVRRRGAFRDALLATERVLAAGIRPRWQLFLTTRILPELGKLLDLAQQMRLYERTEALGGEFQIFLHTPGPEGEAWHIEHLRPSVEDLARVPAELVVSSQRYLGRSLGEAEGDLVAQLAEEEPSLPSVYGYPGNLGFYITSQCDVYPSIGLEPWWRLGNLRRDTLETIIGSFEEDRTLGLHVDYHVSAAELARRYGRRGSRLLYDAGDLKARWLRLWCEQDSDSVCLDGRDVEERP